MPTFRLIVQIDDGPTLVFERPAPGDVGDFPNLTEPNFATRARQWAAHATVREALLFEALEWAVSQARLIADPTATDFHDPSLVSVESCIALAEARLGETLLQGQPVEAVHRSLDKAAEGLVTKAQCDLKALPQATLQPKPIPDPKYEANLQAITRGATPPPTPSPTQNVGRSRPPSLSVKGRVVSAEQQVLAETSLNIITLTQSEGVDTVQGNGKGTPPSPLQPDSKIQEPEITSQKSQAESIEGDGGKGGATHEDRTQATTTTRRSARNRTHPKSNENVEPIQNTARVLRSARQNNTLQNSTSASLLVPAVAPLRRSSPRLRDTTTKTTK